VKDHNVFKTGVLDPKNEGTEALQNICSYSPSDTVLHSGGLKPSLYGFFKV